MIRDLLEKTKLTLSESQICEFEILLEAFKDWNSKINLSALKTDEDIIIKHFLDSLLLTKNFDLSNRSVLDLGTGGGFPTLPLAIFYNGTDTEFTALDAVNKKLKAVQAMADELDLNVKTIHGRAEDLAQDKKFRGKFDFVVTRAVAPWPVLLELTLPFLKVGGRLIAYQGPAIADDLETFQGLEHQLGGEVMGTLQADLLGNTRYFVAVKKMKPTARKFPRPAGEPKRNPLKKTNSLVGERKSHHGVI